jgi:threonine/homoserine/homoserine lactone efflux protein
MVTSMVYYFSSLVTGRYGEAISLFVNIAIAVIAVERVVALLRDLLKSQDAASFYYRVGIPIIAFCMTLSLSPTFQIVNFFSAIADPLLGVIVMVTTVGAGLGRVFELYPMIEVFLKWVSLVYLGWLALKIARAGTPQSRVVATPMSFLAAAAFQWVNPKAWGMALSAIAPYAPDHSLAGALVVALTFGAVGPPTVSLWCLLGVRLREFLTSPARLKAFNWTMAALLILSTLPVLFH